MTISGRYRRFAWQLLQAVLFGILLTACGIRSGYAQFTRFENYTDEQGLGNASVSALAQDVDGYILIGTEAGLYRSDGSTISAYGTSTGLPSASWIRKIATDRAGRIWVMTTDGVYRRDGARFERIDTGKPLHLISPHLLAFTKDSVVIDNGGTLLRAQLDRNAVGPFSSLLEQTASGGNAASPAARFVVSDNDGTLLIGCGAAICRLKNGGIQTLGTADGLPADAWQVALRTPDGTLWARSLDRLAWRRPGQSSFVAVTVPGRRGHFNIAVPARLDLLADGQGGVLTQGEEGLLDYHAGSWRTYLHHEGGLSANPVESLMFDREQSLWVGSIGHGAFRSLGLSSWEHWTVSDGLPSEIVWAMTRLRDGQFWVATYNESVQLGGTTPGIPGGSENLAATGAGRLWLAPLRAPLVRVDMAHKTVERLAVTGNMSSMYTDPENRLWLSTDKGLLAIADADAPINEIKPSIVLPEPTTKVITDRHGAVWAATSAGILRRRPSGSFQLVIPSSLLGGPPGGLAFAGNGDLWAFTDSSGVLRFRLTGQHAERLAPITAPLIGSDNVMFLHCDHRNWMWVGTDHGIDMFNGGSWRHFDIADGLISNDIDQGAVYEDRDGSMWFGTSRGLTHLTDPTRLPPVRPLHPMVTGLSIGKHALPLSSSIGFNWSSEPLVVHFVDLDFARGRNIVFRYRMGGLDAGWSETSGQEVRYARLPAGELHFELVAVDPIHGSISAPVGLTLHIRAPWWRRWWFYASCVLALASTIVGTWQVRVRLLLHQRRRLEKLVNERTAEIEQARSELQRLAMSDALTGLPNRRAIMGMLEEAIATSLSTTAPLAVLLCDIDHFKTINDGYGHLAGDAVLTAFGGRLLAAIELPEAAGRYGGEEFCVLLPASRKDVLERVAFLRSAIADAPYRFGRLDRTVTSSGGLAFLREGDTALSLLARADAALYRAKERGRNRIEQELLEEAAHGKERTKSEALGRSQGDDVSDGHHDQHSSETAPRRSFRGRSDLERDLRLALAEGQFLLNYQPVVDVERDVVTSCEALIRWHSPTRGKVSPSEFIPFAEQAGLMPEIGDWVLRAACKQAAGWSNPIGISVNLSAVQFRLPDLVARVEAALAATGLAAERLELEVTETAMIEEMEAAVCTLQQLRDLGITVALDDFGTGYSSLSFLRTLPFDRVKIDRSFVQDLGKTPQATVIVRSIAAMCAGLGASVTVEGVETDEQIRTLRMIGCSEIQGYRIARPCSEAELVDWMAAFTASHTGGVVT